MRRVSFLSPPSSNGTCALPALSAGVASSGDRVRDQFQTLFNAMLKPLTDLLLAAAPRKRTRASARRLGIGIVALMVGGIVLARAVRNTKISNGILSACRSTAKELAGLNRARP